MASNPRFTIGVALCSYNGQRYIEEQLESIARQTRRPDLLVVCDDGSTDETVQRLERFAARAPFRTVVERNARNLGFVRNFEKAIGLVDADLIVFADQDDVWVPEKLLRVESLMQANPRAQGVFADAAVVDEALVPLGYGMFESLRVSPDERRLIRAGQLFRVLMRRNLVTGASLAIRSSARSAILPIPEGAVHDEWIALVLSSRRALEMHDEQLIAYRQHGSNQIGGRRRSLSMQWAGLWTSRRPENLRLLAVMRSLRSRLLALGSSGDDECIRLVDAKIAHLERRVAMPRFRPSRLGTVLGELLSGRYATYSSGWRMAVRDLLSPL